MWLHAFPLGWHRAGDSSMYIWICRRRWFWIQNLDFTCCCADVAEKEMNSRCSFYLIDIFIVFISRGNLNGRMILSISFFHSSTSFIYILFVGFWHSFSGFSHVFWRLMILIFVWFFMVCWRIYWGYSNKKWRFFGFGSFSLSGIRNSLFTLYVLRLLFESRPKTRSI